MQVEKHETFDILVESDIVEVRQRARQWAIELKFGIVDQTKMLTAASELARNTLIYGGGGRVYFEMLHDDLNRSGLRLTFEDEGPGIPDIDIAMADHYSTGGGLGLGLSGSKRLVNDFQIKSEPGLGTRVSVTRWK